MELNDEGSSDATTPILKDGEPGEPLSTQQQQDGNNNANVCRTAYSWLEETARHHYHATVAQVPPRYKWLCLFVWVAWKFVAVYLVYHVMSPSTAARPVQWVPSPPVLPHESVGVVDAQSSSLVRVLYIVTTTTYEDGGDDDDEEVPYETLIQRLPLLKTNVATLLEQGFHVDIVWILQGSSTSSSKNGTLALTQKLRGRRRRTTTKKQPITTRQTFQTAVSRAFPSQVGLLLWPHASALVPNPTTGRLDVMAQQQQQEAWFVIRDKFPFYHAFLVWPDAARVTGAHVSHFWRVSQRMQQQNMTQHIPAVIPVFASNTTTTRADSNATLMTTTLPAALRVGPRLDSGNGTMLQTVVASSSSPSCGFMVTRWQLAQRGLFDCLVPATPPTTMPTIAWTNATNQKHACQQTLDSSLLVLENEDLLRSHFVEFLQRPAEDGKKEQFPLQELLQHVEMLRRANASHAAVPQRPMKNQTARVATKS